MTTDWGHEVQPFEEETNVRRVPAGQTYTGVAQATTPLTPEETHDMILTSALGAAETARDGARTALGWLRILEPEHEFSDLIKELDSLVYKIDQKIKDAGI